MTDKRILKTRQALKSTLIDMMKSQPFQKIRVKDLCEQANTSKLTFYTHYDDKYALLQDVAFDMEQEVMEKYMELKEQDVSENDIVQHNRHLLQAILYVRDKYKQVFDLAKKEKSYSFFMFFCEELINAFSDKDRFLIDIVKMKYPPFEISAFLIAGMWGYTYAAKKNNVSETLLHEQLIDLATDLSKSNIFLD